MLLINEDEKDFVTGQSSADESWFYCEWKVPRILLWSDCTHRMNRDRPLLEYSWVDLPEIQRTKICQYKMQ
jgi:hypothetical protein